MAGTLTHTVSTDFHRLVKHTFAWVSDGSGDVNSNALEIRAGAIKQVKFVPDSGGTQPTNLYDVTLADEDGADLLAGAGADLSNATATVAPLTLERIHDGSQKLDLVVANAGINKGGTVIIWTGVVGAE